VDRYDIEVTTDGRRLFEGLLFLALYCITIPAADYLTMHVGLMCEPNGPCKIPVAPGLAATTGAFPIAATYVLRDFIQRRFGLAVSFCIVVMGAALASYLAPPALVVASGAAVFAAGLVDLAIYTWIVRKNFVTAVVTSSLISCAVDSAVFLWLAFSSIDLVAGQTLAKAWVILALLPFTFWLWKRDQRIGLAPA
jgi:uncharacterized PurR-regulated membrane protein YhhQ (DUF165 family)